LNQMMTKIKTPYFLLIGVLFLALAHMTINIGFLGWLAYAPFLIYLRRTTGGWRRVHVLLALIVGWSLVVAKIITPPLIYPFIFMYSVPIALIHFPAFLIWDRFKDHKWGIFTFPSRVNHYWNGFSTHLPL
jgi:hypothetical protein